MKKAVLIFAVMSFILVLACVSCSNSAGGSGSTSAVTDSSSGGTGGTGGTNEGVQTGGTGGVTVDEDGTVTINSAKMVYIGEGQETVDNVEYRVKKYAQLVFDDNPYFYTYYKLYFLNGKLRRMYICDHGTNAEMDYKYDEFVEHACGWEWRWPKIYGYYENGKLAYYSESENKWEPQWDYKHKVVRHEYYLNENGVWTLINEYVDGALYSKQEYEYYANGKTKTDKTYTNTNTKNPSEGTLYLSKKRTYLEDGIEESYIEYQSDGTEKEKRLFTFYDNGKQKSYENYTNGKLSSKSTYIENGNLESRISYAADGITETSKELYTYYNSGNPKKAISYSNGELTRTYTFYDEKVTTSIYLDGIGSFYGKKKLLAYYNTNSSVSGTSTTYLSNISHYYSSGYLKHYYSGGASGGTFYTYEDNKTTTLSISSSVYSTMETYTQEQAEAKLAELLNE